MSVAVENKSEALREFMKQMQERPYPRSNLIAVLHRAQELYGHLNKDVMDEVAQGMNIPTAHIWGVATFYHFFNLTPRGQHTIYVCLGTACYVKGAHEILNTLKKELHIDIGQTTEDGLFTLQETRCLGACGLAPVIMIDDKIYGDLTPKKTVELLNEFRKQGR